MFKYRFFWWTALGPVTGWNGINDRPLCEIGQLVPHTKQHKQTELTIIQHRATRPWKTRQTQHKHHKQHISGLLLTYRWRKIQRNDTHHQNWRSKDNIVYTRGSVQPWVVSKGAKAMRKITHHSAAVWILWGADFTNVQKLPNRRLLPKFVSKNSDALGAVYLSNRQPSEPPTSGSRTPCLSPLPLRRDTCSVVISIISSTAFFQAFSERPHSHPAK